MAKTISKCVECSYPLTSDNPGQVQACPMCSTLNESISDITISTPVLVGILFFSLGMFIGPSLIATTSGGKKWLEERARGK